MHSFLTIAFVTGRLEPRFDWFLGSLDTQSVALATIPHRLVVVDGLLNRRDDSVRRLLQIRGALHVPVMPNVFQGPHRLTQTDWWAMSTARNTALCFAPDGWIAYCDDRSRLCPTWLETVLRAMSERYVVCGSYQKTVTDDKGMVTVTGTDNRLAAADLKPPYPSGGKPCTGRWLYGCNFALPVEWMLQVGGFEVECDMLSFEDCIFGLMLEKNSLPLRFDPNMSVTQDRTPGHTDPVYRRTDKGKSPDDKSHAMLNSVLHGPRGTARNFYGKGGLAALRQRVLDGKGFPAEPIGFLRDWYDSQPIQHMT